MDFNELVGQRVQIVAAVDKIIKDFKTVKERILLSNVYINDVYFRDHHWVKMSKKLKVLSSGDKFTATAEVYLYIDVDTNKCDKVGLRSFRSVKRDS